MKPFRSIRSVAAVLEEDDVDTDIIFPARFLLLLDKAGLGRHVFHERRQPRAGEPRFVLDTPPFDRAQILIAGRNFGSGSSREQAVWALADFGIRCVIAPSFGEIFYGNCFKNGVLPIRLAETQSLRERAARGEEIEVNLETLTILCGNSLSIPFETESFRREALLEGLDEIGAILTADGDAIRAFEAGQRQSRPWLHLGRDKLAHFDDLDEEKALG